MALPKRKKLSEDFVRSDDEGHEVEPSSFDSDALDKTEDDSWSRNADGEPYLDLGKKKRLTIRKWRGMTLIDLREFWGDDDSDLKPGKKGISLSLEQWKGLCSKIGEIESKIEERG